MERLGTRGQDVGDRLRPRDRLDDAADEMRELQCERLRELGEVDPLEPATVRLERRVLGGQERPQQLHPLDRPDDGRHLLPLDVDPPADLLPVAADVAELAGLGVLVGVGGRDAEGLDAGIGEAEDEVSGRDLAHRVVERVPAPAGVALGRPEIAAGEFVAEGLVLVHPPIAHERDLVRRPFRLWFGGDDAPT
jgi:hypothetical protein